MQQQAVSRLRGLVRHALSYTVLAGLALILTAGTTLAAPRLELGQTSVDFGRVPQHQVLRRAIALRNVGDAELLISEVYTSCPCTEVTLGAESLAPGAETVLDLVFHSRDLQGLNDKTVEITSNDPEQSLSKIRVLAFVAAPITVEPADRKLDFGEVALGEAKTLTVILAAEDRPALDLSIASYDAERFDLALEPMAEDPRRAELRVTLCDDALAGLFRGVLSLNTGDARQPRIDLELSGLVRGELIASPSRLNFRFARPGQDLSKELVIKAESAGGAFRVTGAEVDLPGLSATVLADGSGGEARLRVSGQALAADAPLAKESGGKLKGQLTIFTDRPREPELRVDLLYILR